MLQNDRINMTAAEFGWTAVAILLLGVLAGWGLFSTPQLGPRLLANGGSVADWLAAAGTWVIGFGAWKYARASHEHHLREARSAELAEQNRIMSGLTSLVLIMGRASTPTYAFETFDEKGPGWSSELRDGLEGVLSILREINWNCSERALLSGEALDNFSLSELECHRFISNATAVLKKLGGIQTLTDLQAAEMTQVLRASAARLTEHLDHVRPFVVAERRRVSERLKLLAVMQAT